jgi:uncharacterized protein YnzC (UPF0291/DUF896 family)
MELLKFEKKSVERYISAISQHRAPRDIITDCRDSIIGIMKTVLIEKYNYSEGSAEVKEPTKSFFKTDFFGSGEGRDFKPHNQAFQNAKNYINIITGSRNPVTYLTEDPETLPEEARQCRNALQEFLTWYFSNYKKYYLETIATLNTTEKSEVAHLFVTRVQRSERITERETYYVVLLIDSSQSMVWPYLKDPNNSNKETSADYKNAITEVQKTMQFAHEKALQALRGSSICKEGYLKIYQYTFNHKKKVLNLPEELSPVGKDKVEKISGSNYLPDGMTALYNVIDESLKVVYDDYLKRTMEEDKRIDKVIIGVITDGEDTVVSGSEKSNKIAEIKQYLKMLRGSGDIKKNFLVSSVLIGLTGTDFSENKLKEIKKELSFDESVSINQADEQSIRKAFKLFSTNAINV